MNGLSYNLVIKIIKNEMSKLIVKDNSLMQASYTLDMVEQRLILLAIAKARETDMESLKIVF